MLRDRYILYGCVHIYIYIYIYIYIEREREREREREGEIHSRPKILICSSQEISAYFFIYLCKFIFGYRYVAILLLITEVQYRKV